MATDYFENPSRDEIKALIRNEIETALGLQPQFHPQLTAAMSDAYSLMRSDALDDELIFALQRLQEEIRNVSPVV
jgi:hypothetical protein